MDQISRDLAYENGDFIPGAEAIAAGWSRDAAAYRAATPCEIGLSYGDHPREAFDLFYPDGESRGLVVFVHGGYWKARARSDWSHFAEGARARGFTVAMIGYPLCPEVRISQITQCVRRAIGAVSERIAGPIHLVGHSAGGHLVARMIMADGLPEPIRARIGAVLPISPVSDLRPLLDLSMNAVLGLDPQEAAQESPVLGRALAGQVTVVVGAQERAAFLDQARWLAQAWSARLMILPGRHHFDVIDGLADRDSALISALTAPAC